MVPQEARDNLSLLSFFPSFLFLFLFIFAAVTNAAQLIGCGAQELMLSLSSNKVKSGDCHVAQKLTLQQVC